MLSCSALFTIACLQSSSKGGLNNWITIDNSASIHVIMQNKQKLMQEN